MEVEMDEYKLMTPAQVAEFVGKPTAEELAELPEYWQRAVLTILGDVRQQLLATPFRRSPLPLQEEQR